MRKECDRVKLWGMSSSIDLKGCAPDRIQDEEYIRSFACELCDLIKMRRYGDPLVVDFGDDPEVSGFTLVQLIETSSIVAHFANASNAAYIDIFSCRSFDSDNAAEFCKNYFGADSFTINTINRF